MIFFFQLYLDHIIRCFVKFNHFSFTQLCHEDMTYYGGECGTDANNLAPPYLVIGEDADAFPNSKGSILETLYKEAERTVD